MEIIEAFAVKNKCYCVCCSELIHFLSRKRTNTPRSCWDVYKESSVCDSE